MALIPLNSSLHCDLETNYLANVMQVETDGTKALTVHFCMYFVDISRRQLYIYIDK